MTVIAFARKLGVTPERLYWWRRRLRETDKPKGKRSRRRKAATISLIPAQVVSDAAATTGVVVRLPDDVVIDLGDASPVWVAALIRELVQRG